MLGECLRKLCTLDSFGYAFREKKTVRKSTPGGCKTGPRGVQNASWAQKAARKPCLGGSLVALLEPARKPCLGGPGAVLGASWVPGRSRVPLASFWDPPRADLDDLDVVCGAT